MMSIRKLRMATALIALLPLTALANSLNIEKVTSTSFVPGQEGIYVISLVSAEALDLSTGSQLTFELPEGFSLVKEDILAANPGVTLANIQYKYPGDKFFSVITGQTSVKTTAQTAQMHLTIEKGDKEPIRPNTQLFITVPGVINGTNQGSYPIQISFASNSGKTNSVRSTVTLGRAPMQAPANLQAVAASTYEFAASWDNVADAEYYQLYYALTPDGTYIQACDFSRDPNPDERWLLTDTKVSFSGQGNGGILADRNYYFKVRAGNEYGFGPLSPAISVRTPAVLVTGILVTDHGMIELTCNQSVKINALNRIEVYDKATGNPINESAEVNGAKLILQPELKAGSRYQVVLYEDALESAEQPGVFNAVFVFDFTAREVM